MIAFLTGGYEWLIILVVALLLFGRRLPKVMRSMGEGIQEFKKGLRGVKEDIDRAGEDEEPRQLGEGEEEEGTESSENTTDHSS